MPPLEGGFRIHQRQNYFLYWNYLSLAFFATQPGKVCLLKVAELNGQWQQLGFATGTV
jgi:hypothetical protein